MEATPSLACANKCTFCWRHHKNPVGTEWRWKMDPPREIVKEAIRLHQGMINEYVRFGSILSMLDARYIPYLWIICLYQVCWCPRREERALERSFHRPPLCSEFGWRTHHVRVRHRWLTEIASDGLCLLRVFRRDLHCLRIFVNAGTLASTNLLVNCTNDTFLRSWSRTLSSRSASAPLHL